MLNLRQFASKFDKKILENVQRNQTHVNKKTECHFPEKKLWGVPQHRTGLATYVISVINVIWILNVINVMCVDAILHKTT